MWYGILQEEQKLAVEKKLEQKKIEEAEMMREEKRRQQEEMRKKMDLMWKVEEQGERIKEVSREEQSYYSIIT